MECRGTTSNGKGSTDHRNPCKHKGDGYTDVRRSEEEPCGDAFEEPGAASKMIGDEDALAVARHERMDHAKHKGHCHQVGKAIQVRGRPHRFGEAAVKPALRSN